MPAYWSPWSLCHLSSLCQCIYVPFAPHSQSKQTVLSESNFWGWHEYKMVDHYGISFSDKYDETIWRHQCSSYWSTENVNFLRLNFVVRSSMLGFPSPYYDLLHREFTFHIFSPFFWYFKAVSFSYWFIKIVYAFYN